MAIYLDYYNYVGSHVSVGVAGNYSQWSGPDDDDWMKHRNTSGTVTFVGDDGYNFVSASVIQQDPMYNTIVDTFDVNSANNSFTAKSSYNYYISGCTATESGGSSSGSYSATVNYKIDGSWGNKEVIFYSSSSSFTIDKSDYEDQISTDLSDYYYLGCSTGSSWTQSQQSTSTSITTQDGYKVVFYYSSTPPTTNYYYSIYRVLQNSSYSGSATLYSSAQAYPATSAPSVSANSFSVTTPTGYYRRGISTNSNLGSSSVSASVSITSTSSSSPTKIYYYYYPNSYSVIYNANNGTGTTSSTARYYNEAYTLATSGFSRTGYNFAGWKLNNAGTTYAAGATVPATTSTETLTYYAQWSAASYTVKYNLNGATGTINSTTRYYNTSYTLTSTHPRWTGHNFLGWRLNNSGTLYQPGATIAASTSTSTLEYYAQWEIKTHTITYDANGGSGAPSQTTQNYDTYHTVTSTVPSRQGYKFLGWSENSSDVEPTYYAGNSIIIEKDLILYAIWTKAKDPFYWTGSSSISLQQGELINNYINSTKINEFQTKIKNEINSSYSPLSITSTTLITKALYNALATILNISQVSDNEKITAQHWINLQNAYNNYD